MKWLVTGSAGFIGSNLCARLLEAGVHVIGLDNLSTGKRANIDRVLSKSDGRYQFIEGDICDRRLLRKLAKGTEAVVHLAAQGSVQKSFADIGYNNLLNIDGFVSVLAASEEQNVPRFIYASSCAVYGDSNNLPISEKICPRPLSPYASSKLMNDLLAFNLQNRYPNTTLTGLRFFNIFGPWQDPFGDYAAVIPRWIDGCLKGEQPIIYGDGSATRDFCYVGNVCETILNIGLGRVGNALGVYNISSGKATSLEKLCLTVFRALNNCGIKLPFEGPQHLDWRKGDIVHSHGDISRARRELSYEPAIDLEQGIALILDQQYCV